MTTATVLGARPTSPHTVDFTASGTGELWRESQPSLADAPSATWLVRQLLPGDARHLVRRAGPTIDALYPQGAAKFSATVDEALNGYASAYVVAWPSGMPAALICEKQKGRGRVKVSTFWVDPAARLRGAGQLLANSRGIEWRNRELEEIYGTCRYHHTDEISRVFGPMGFLKVFTAENRYGEGQHEDVLQWRPSHDKPGLGAGGRLIVCNKMTRRDPRGILLDS